jgi:putative protease
MELVCPAGNALAARKAVENGADAVYVGLNDHTNARYFSGLNLAPDNMAATVDFVHSRGKRIFLAINTYPQPKGWRQWEAALKLAAELQMDAVIIADQGVLAHAADRHPDLPRHLSVQASATSHEALSYYEREFGIRRAVLPRVLSLQQVERLAQKTSVELEVFGFGSLCIMAEGRCYLSSYLTGDSPNNCGACSPAHAVRWVETPGGGLETRLNQVLIDRFQPGEPAGYPTLCKGRFEVNGQVYHAMEEPTSLNTLDLLPSLLRSGIKAIKLEGRQRSPAYVAQAVRVWREALDRVCEDAEHYRVEQRWQSVLASLSEGSQTTLGAYSRPWQ